MIRTTISCKYSLLLHVSVTYIPGEYSICVSQLLHLISRITPWATSGIFYEAATVKLHDAIRMDEDPMYLWDMAATDTITFFIISVNATPKNARQDARRTYWRHGSVRGTDGNFQDQASCCWFHRYMVSIMFAIRTAEMVRDSGVILAVCRWDSRLWRW